MGKLLCEFDVGVDTAANDVGWNRNGVPGSFLLNVVRCVGGRRINFTRILLGLLLMIYIKLNLHESFKLFHVLVKNIQ